MSDTTYNYYLTLVNKAKLAAKAYYDTDSEIMSDAEYDEIVDQIEYLENKHGWTAGKSLTSEVAAGQSSGGDTHHAVRMLSLRKVNTAERLQDFINTVKSVASDAGLVVEPKLDGLALSAKYRNGKLVELATRGDGSSGENITDRITSVQGLPSSIPFTGDIEVRGEVFITDADFTIANKNRLQYEYKKWIEKNPNSKQVTIESLYRVALSNKENTAKQKLKGERTDFYPDKHIFANPRNAVSGTLMRKTVNPYNVPVTFACYDALLVTPSFVRYSELIKFVKTLGINTSLDLIPKELAILPTLDMVKNFGELRAAGLDFPTDGVVIKADDFTVRKTLGEGTKAPYWAVAYKYPSSVKKTTVEDIEVTVGRTGRLALRARLQPVLLDGSLISYVNLHNVSWVENKDVRIGDNILLKKANDVISHVEGVVLSDRPSTAVRWTAPAVCPKCGEAWDKSTLLWRCESPSCGQLNGIIFAAGRDYFDWDGLSEAIITRLNDVGLVNDMADMFSLTKHQLVTLPMGTNKEGETRELGKNGEKIYEEILKSKTRPLYAVIAALGVRTLGRTYARRLESHYGSMKKILEASPAELTQIGGIAEKKAQLIHDGLKAKLPLIKKLAQAGVTMVSTAKVSSPANSLFKDKKIVISGSIPGMTRSEAQNYVIGLGGTPSSSVSSTTDYLIADAESAGNSKYKKAQQLGVRILSPKEFLTLANQK